MTLLCLYDHEETAREEGEEEGRRMRAGWRQKTRTPHGDVGKKERGALLFSGVHSHLMLRQHLLIHLPKAKQPLWVLSEVPKYWLEDDGAMCLDEAHRWRSADTIARIRAHGLYSVPNSIKAEIGDLVYNRDRGRASNDPPPSL